MTPLRAVFGALASRSLLVWLAGGWIVFYVISAIWKKEAFATFAGSLSESPLNQGLFALFLLSGLCNLARGSQKALRRGTGWFALWLWLPLGVLLFFGGFFLSMTGREFVWLLVGEGDEVAPRWSAGRYRVVSVDHGLKERFLDIDVEGGGGIFLYEPSLVLEDAQGLRHRVGAFPPTKVDGSYYHILNFGLAPAVRLMERGQTSSEGYVVLRIMAPGSSDTFEMPPSPFRFILSMEPERVIEKGAVKAAEYNVRNPVFRVRVFREEEVVFEGLSSGEMAFGDYRLEFGPPIVWVQLEAVRDRGVPLILAGLALIAVGLLLVPLRVILRLRGVGRGTSEELI